MVHTWEQVKKLRVKSGDYFNEDDFFVILFFVLTGPACILGTHERLVAGNPGTLAQLSRLP